MIEYEDRTKTIASTDRSISSKEELRSEISDEVEKFLKSGGKITHTEDDVRTGLPMNRSIKPDYNNFKY